MYSLSLYLRTMDYNLVTNVDPTGRSARFQTSVAQFPRRIIPDVPQPGPSDLGSMV